MSWWDKAAEFASSAASAASTAASVAAEKAKQALESETAQSALHGAKSLAASAVGTATQLGTRAAEVYGEEGVQGVARHAAARASRAAQDLLPQQQAQQDESSNVHNKPNNEPEIANSPNVHIAYYERMKKALEDGAQNNYAKAVRESISVEEIDKMIKELQLQKTLPKNETNAVSPYTYTSERGANCSSYPNISLNTTPSDEHKQFIRKQFKGINESSPNFLDKSEGKQYLDYVLRASKPKAGDQLQSIQADACSRFVSRCRDQPGALILHSVGSGKTRTGICLAMGFPKKHRITVITPTGLEVAWKQEFEKLCMDDGDVAGCSTNASHKQKVHNVMKIDDAERILYLDFKTLETLLNSTDEASKRSLSNYFEDTVVVVDEAHYFLNFYGDNKLGKKLSDILNRTHRLYLMTGTPFQKNWGDFGRLINLAARKWPAILPVSEEQLRNKYPIEQSQSSVFSSFVMGGIKQIINISNMLGQTSMFLTIPSKVVESLQWATGLPLEGLAVTSSLLSKISGKVSSGSTVTSSTLSIVSSSFKAAFGELSKTIPLNIDVILKLTSPYMTFYNYTVTERMIESAVRYMQEPTNGAYWDGVLYQFYKMNNYKTFGKSYVESADAEKIKNRRNLEIKLFQIGCVTLDIQLPAKLYLPEINQLITESYAPQHSLYNRFKILKIALNDVFTKLEKQDCAEKRTTQTMPHTRMYRDVVENTFNMLNAILYAHGSELASFFGSTSKFSNEKIVKSTLLTDLLSFPRKEVIIENVPFTEWQQGIYYGNAISPEFTYQHELYLVGRLTDDDLQRYDGGNAQLQGELTKQNFMEHMRICGNLSPDKLYLKTKEVRNQQQLYDRCFESTWRTPAELDQIMSQAGYTYFNSQVEKLLKSQSSNTANAQLAKSPSANFNLKQILGEFNKTPDAKTLPGSMGCPKFEYALNIILESRMRDDHIPVVFSNFIKNGFESFSAYLTSLGLKHIVLHADDATAVSQLKIDTANLTSYKTIPTKSLDALKEVDGPCCIILHPSLKEGLSFTNNEVMIVLEPVMGAGNQEQVYGRVLRRFGIPQMPRKVKKIHVLVSNDVPMNKDDITQIATPTLWRKFIAAMPEEFRIPTLFRLHKVNVRIPESVITMCEAYESNWKKDAITAPVQNGSVDSTTNSQRSETSPSSFSLKFPGFKFNIKEFKFNPSHLFKKINSSYSFTPMLFSPNLGLWQRILSANLKSSFSTASRTLTNPLSRVNPGQALQAEVLQELTVTADSMTMLYNEQQEKEVNLMFDGMNSLSDEDSLCADNTKGIKYGLNCERFRSIDSMGTCISTPSFRQMVLPSTGEFTGKQYTVKDLMKAANSSTLSIISNVEYNDPYNYYNQTAYSASNAPVSGSQQSDPGSPASFGMPGSPEAFSTGGKYKTKKSHRKQKMRSWKLNKKIVRRKTRQNKRRLTRRR